VVEPDALARLALVSLLKASADVNVVGLASDAMQARMQVKSRKPDAILIATDQHTEKVDQFLSELMDGAGLAVLMLSDKILPSSDGERKALRAGGAIVTKPANGVKSQDQAFAQKIVLQLQRIVSNFKPASIAPKQASVAKTLVHHTASDQTASGAKRHHPVMDTLLAIGASTGGTNALRQVVKAFPSDFSAIVIVQHIPKAFAASFIEKLDKASCMRVVSACDGDEICHGHIYVGAGDEHFSVEKQGSRLICRVGGKEKIDGHCPSVNALFDSVARCVGSKAVGALMTGMGEDGATGLKKMRDARARTVAQDKQSSVVWGMPGTAVRIGAAEVEVSLDQLGEKLIQLVK